MPSRAGPRNAVQYGFRCGTADGGVDVLVSAATVGGGGAGRLTGVGGDALRCASTRAAISVAGTSRTRCGIPEPSRRTLRPTPQCSTAAVAASTSAKAAATFARRQIILDC